MTAARGLLPVLVALGVVLGLGTTTASAQASPAIPFRGLLLDSNGAPVSGTADMVFRLFDALTGGTERWAENHSDVSAVDGIYSVHLGETTPIAPVVLTGDALFLEIVVGGETMTPRHQFLAVPLAMVAEKANRVGSLPGAYYEQWIAHAVLDGGDPPNLDPSEGTGDTDGDGLANFIDPDNDDDGYLDTEELENGTDINVVNARVTDVMPSGVVPTFTNLTFSVTGTHLAAATSVQIGSDVVTPYNVSATGLDFDYIYATPTDGPVVVAVTTSAGDTATWAQTIYFRSDAIEIDAAHPRLIWESEPTVVGLVGEGFVAAMSVEVDGAPASFDFVDANEVTVTVASPAGASTSIEVLHPSSEPFLDDAVTISNVPAGSKLMFATDTSYQGNFGGLAGADAICQAEATTYSLPGTYKAWLSDSVNSPSTTFVQSPDPYYNLLAERVADDWADLLTGIDAELYESPSGGYAVPWAWTGTTGSGTAFGGGTAHCNGWTSLSVVDQGRFGSLGGTSGEQWTSSGSTFCNSSYRLICVEQ